MSLTNWTESLSLSMGLDQIVLATWVTPVPFSSPETMSHVDLVPPTQTFSPLKQSSAFKPPVGSGPCPMPAPRLCPGQSERVLAAPASPEPRTMQDRGLTFLPQFVFYRIQQGLGPWPSLLLTLVTLGDAASDFCLSFLLGNVIRIFITEQLYEYNM